MEELDYKKILLSNIIVKTILSPLERLKLIYQCQNSLPVDQPRIHGTFQHLKNINQGLGYLTRGNLANIQLYLTQKFIQYQFYDNIKSIFYPEDKNLGFHHQIAISISCGLITSVFCYPLDLARTLISLDFNKKYQGTFNCLRFQKQQGQAHKYRGFVFANISQIPSSILSIILYEQGQVDQKIIIGASLLSQLIVYPFDTLRRRMIVSDMKFTKYPVYNQFLIMKQQPDFINQLFKGIHILTIQKALQIPLYLFVADSFRNKSKQ